MAPPLRSLLLLDDSLATPPRSFPCSRPTRPLVTAGFPGAVRSNRRRNWNARERRDLRICASTVEAEYGRPEEDVADDYYSVLGVMPDATPEEIKKAYYGCMKACHPDLSGDDPDVMNFVHQRGLLGCKNCANICPNVFQIEENFGRSRVYSQWGSTELIQEAFDN